MNLGRVNTNAELDIPKWVVEMANDMRPDDYHTSSSGWAVIQHEDGLQEFCLIVAERKRK